MPSHRQPHELNNISVGEDFPDYDNVSGSDDEPQSDASRRPHTTHAQHRMEDQDEHFTIPNLGDNSTLEEFQLVGLIHLLWV